ncbi:MAG: PEP-CTERM sorting domain-containing protein [Akkermansiaceae bacterium]
MMKRLLPIGTAIALTTGVGSAATSITIQPHTSGGGYVVTYSWKGTFANGMDGGSNGSNAYIDDNTVRFSTNYSMTSGNHSGSLIRYSQHNNDGVNGNFAVVPAAGSGLAVHWDGSDGESLTAGNAMGESSHSNIFFTENGGNWYNNPTDYGGVRFFGTGVQGAQSLTSWNGINSSSAFGNVQFEGSNLLGQGMQFGVNGGNSGATGGDSARFGMIGDAGYWNALDSAGMNNGLLMGFFPYAGDAPSGAEFTDQFNLGTYTSGDTTMVIVNDANYVPILVTADAVAPIPEPSSTLLIGLSSLLLIRRRR